LGPGSAGDEGAWKLLVAKSVDAISVVVVSA